MAIYVVEGVPVVVVVVVILSSCTYHLVLCHNFFFRLYSSDAKLEMNRFARLTRFSLTARNLCASAWLKAESTTERELFAREQEMKCNREKRTKLFDSQRSLAPLLLLPDCFCWCKTGRGEGENWGCAPELGPRKLSAPFEPESAHTGCAVVRPTTVSQAGSLSRVESSAKQSRGKQSRTKARAQKARAPQPQLEMETRRKAEGRRRRAL